jgi:hypothetical protein
MTALQDEQSGLTLLLTFGPSYVREKSEGAKTTLEVAEYGLLVPFVEGLHEAARGATRIVDGHESSYGYRDVVHFDAALRTIREARPRLEPGFGLWLDYDHSKYGWDGHDPSKNYFTPEGLESSLRAAFERADEIVWLYNETPRWWTEQGGPLKLPAAYVDAIRHVREKLALD